MASVAAASSSQASSKENSPAKPEATAAPTTPAGSSQEQRKSRRSLHQGGDEASTSSQPSVKRGRPPGSLNKKTTKDEKEGRNRKRRRSEPPETGKRKNGETPMQKKPKKRSASVPVLEKGWLSKVDLNRWWIVPGTTAPVYNLMLKPKAVDDLKIDETVERDWTKTPQEQYDQSMREIAEATAKGRKCHFPVNFLIASTDRHLTRIATNFIRYGRCSFVLLDKGFMPAENGSSIIDLQFAEFWLRSMVLDIVVARIKQEMGEKEYALRYPHRYIEKEKGETDSYYCTKPNTLYKSRLRAFEWRVCLEAEKANQPPIFFEDFTGNNTQLPTFKYTPALMPSKRVRKAMRMRDDYEHYKCRKDTCDGEACESRVLQRVFRASKKDERSCGCILKNETRSGTVVDKCPLECNANCECDPAICGNRVVQKGRQFPFFVWADWRKGFTARAATKIKKGDFIGEYTGEVITSTESKLRDHEHLYDMDMPNNRTVDDPKEKRGKRKHKKLVIDGSIWGNETRFISHSCEPNLTLVQCYVERCGGWFSRMVFVANQDIEIGEEMTFDYFPNLKFEHRDKNHNHIFVHCFCDSENCKFSSDPAAVKLREKIMAQVLKKREEERDEQDEDYDYDSWSEGESDDDTASEEDKAKKKEERAKKLTKQRDDRAAARERAAEEMKRREEEEEESDGDEE